MNINTQHTYKYSRYYHHDHMRQPGVGGVQLPSIGQLFSGNLLSNRNQNKHVGETNVVHEHSYECSYVTPHVHSPSRMEHEIELLENHIQSLETLITKQSRIIQNYETENKKRKLENEELKLKLEETEQKKRKQRKVSKVSDIFINDTFTMSKPLTIEEESNDTLGDLDEFSVIWKGETFILIDAFKNRNKIINHFIPLYQTQFPDKKCKIVLSSDEYRQLFKENSHRCQSERKHAWRISIFTLDFYNFVKNQM